MSDKIMIKLGKMISPIYCHFGFHLWFGHRLVCSQGYYTDVQRCASCGILRDDSQPSGHE